MKDWKKNILKYFIELLIVAFGVFLGMYISERKSNDKVRHNTVKSLSYIIDELESNQKSLSESIRYHETIKTNLGKITGQLNEEEIGKFYFESKVFHIMKIEGWTGVGLPNFKTISFEGAKINNVLQELDFEVVQQIANAYKQIEFNQEFGNSVLEKMIQTNSTTKVIDVVRMVELLTSDILNTEKELNAELENVISYLIEHEKQQQL